MFYEHKNYQFGSDLCQKRVTIWTSFCAENLNTENILLNNDIFGTQNREAKVSLMFF